MANRLQGFAIPPARDHRAVGLADIASKRKHQRERVLCGGNGVAARGVHHHHAVVGGGGTIDVIDTHAGPADGLEIFRRSENFGGHLGLGTDDEAVVVADDFKKLVRLEAGVHVDGNFWGRAQSVDTFFRNRIRN